MFDPISLGLLGAALGGLTSKKPLKGALLGAGLGAAGGGLLGPSAAGGLFGNPATAMTYGTGLGSQQTAMLAAQEAGMGNGLLGALQGAKPAFDAVGSGMQAASMFDQPDQMIPPPQLAPQTGSQTLAALAAQPQAGGINQSLMARRQARRGLL